MPDLIPESEPDFSAPPPERSRARQPSSSPQRTQTQGRTATPSKAKPHSPLSSQRTRLDSKTPLAYTLVPVRGQPTPSLNTDGIIGDLNDAGFDLLMGHIARINGVTFTATHAFRNHNPGGFGLSLLKVPYEVPLSYLYPRANSSFFRPWMDPFSRLRLGDPQSSAIFPTWHDGGTALREYLYAIRGNAIAAFPLGPMTKIVEVLLAYDAPCSADEAYPWTTIRSRLEEYEHSLPPTA